MHLTDSLRSNPTVAGALQAIRAQLDKCAAAQEVVRGIHAMFIKVRESTGRDPEVEAQLKALRTQRWWAIARGVVGDRKADEKIAAAEARLQEVRKAAEEARDVREAVEAELEAAHRTERLLMEEAKKLQVAAMRVILEARCGEFRSLVVSEIFPAFNQLYALEYELVRLVNAPYVVKVRRPWPIMIAIPGKRIYMEPTVDQLDAAERRVHEILAELGFPGFEPSSRLAAA